MLSGFLPREEAFNAVGNAIFRRLELHGEKFLVFGLSLGEPSGVLVQLLLAIFVRLLARFVGFVPLLRFKPNFGFALFGSKL